MSQAQDAHQSSSAAGPTPGKAALLLLLIAVVCAGFIALTHYLAIENFWAGFVFLFYWGAIEHLKIERLPAIAIGAAFGLLTCMLLQKLPVAWPPYGIVAVLLLIVAMVYCQLMGWLPLVINNATMLYLTVGTIYHIQAHGDFVDIYAGLGAGLLFFGVLVYVGMKFAPKPQSVAAPAE